MKVPKILTQVMARTVLDYVPNTGQLIWKHRADAWFTSDTARKCWNSKLAGKPAFTAVNTSGVNGTYKANRGRLFGKLYLKHRMIWFWMTGAWPIEVDHKNGNSLDNRWKNLRQADRTKNNKNAKQRRDNTSGCTGVYKRADRFIVLIGSKYVGNFPSYEKAVAARKEAEKTYGYSARHGLA